MVATSDVVRTTGIRLGFLARSASRKCRSRFNTSRNKKSRALIRVFATSVCWSLPSLSRKRPERDSSGWRVGRQGAPVPQAKLQEMNSSNQTVCSSRCQQIPSCRGRSVAMRAGSRTMAVDRRGLAGHDTEESAKVLNHFIPRFRRNPQSLKQSPKFFGRDACFL